MGLRINELLNLRIRDVDLKSAELSLIRKGQEEQVLPLPGVAILFLELYLKSKNNNCEYDDPVFINNYGFQMKEASVRSLFHRYAKLANINDYSSAIHSFRHLLFTELYDEDYKNVDLIKILANWSSLMPINTYIHGRPEKLEQFQSNFRTIGCDIYNDRN